MTALVYNFKVGDAVAKSVSKNKPLVVFLTEATPECNKWGDDLILRNSPENIDLLRTKYVLLKLFKGTQEFGYFEEIFKNCDVPSIYFIKTNQLLDVVKGDVTKEAFGQKLVQWCDGVAAPAPAPAPVPVASASASASTEASVPAAASVSSSSANEYKQKVKKQRQLELAEKARIKTLLEQDKKEREAAARRAHTPPSANAASKQVHEHPHKSHHHDKCTLSIRTLDGSRLTREFGAAETLEAVRDWVDHNRTDGDQPYAFFQAVTKKSYSASMERTSLGELGLAPRSVLIMKPEQNYSSAYAKNSGGGWLSYIGSSLHSLFGIRVEPSDEQGSEQPHYEANAAENDNSEFGGAVSPVSNVSQEDLTSSFYSAKDNSKTSLNDTRIRTLTDSTTSLNGEDKKHTYNGNHTNLEDDKKKD